MPQIKGFELVGEFVGDDFGCGTECNDEDCILGLFAGFFEELIAFFEGVFGRADDSFDAGCVVEKIVSDSETRASEILCPWDNRSPPNGCIQ